jgi:hypothetical protein
VRRVEQTGIFNMRIGYSCSNTRFQVQLGWIHHRSVGEEEKGMRREAEGREKRRHQKPEEELGRTKPFLIVTQKLVSLHLEIIDLCQNMPREGNFDFRLYLGLKAIGVVAISPNRRCGQMTSQLLRTGRNAQKGERI